MDDRHLKSISYRVLIGFAAFIVVVAGMRSAQAMIVPFLLAVFLSIICAPMLIWLQKKHLPVWLALIVVILCVLGGGLIMAALLGGALDGFSQAMPVYQEKLNQLTLRFVDWLAGMGISVSRQTFLEFLNPASAMSLASGVLKGLGGVLTNAFLIILTVIFILLEFSTFSSKLRKASGGRDLSFSQINTVLDNVKQYMGIKTMTSLLTGFIVAIGLSLLGVDFPVLWGFLAFLFNFIPNIGSIIAAVPAVLIGLLEMGVGSAIAVSILFLTVNMAIGSMLEPRLMGNKLGLSPLVVFVSLVFWGWVLGPVGMFLSVPLTIAVQIALSSSEDSRWMAVLLGPGIQENE
ncbi:MAG: AI-2E family transporter [Gammaproteobacteria bacterium]